MHKDYLDIVHMLNLLPYFRQHPHRDVLEVAEDLGLPRRRVMQYLERLHCCGVGQYHDELVDWIDTGRTITVLEDQGMNRPIRLTTTEANALLLVLEQLRGYAGLVDKKAVISAAQKIREILPHNEIAVADSIEDDDPHAAKLEVCMQALQSGMQLRFSYYSRTKDTVSDKTVSIIRLFRHDRHEYVAAFDHHVAEKRTFRIEYMQDLEVLTVAADIPRDATAYDATDPFGLQQATEHAKIFVRPASAWLISTIPTIDYTVYEDGSVEAVLSLVSTSWLEQLVLAHGGDITVLEPRNFVQSVRNRAATALKAYDDRK
ncbi:YafY family protein [Corynebacterium sp. HS2168-gen11]|uniref:helix-turn-helix transcriptional regulator n=1 Tax=Corynebacterium sp. HS2168-gen11 TaxID=2974027 RepID=UPI00216B5232|nr:WYL domain-containing protein [Corynebacterium sp. HS2168-gen11]MCS4535078.1 WYL domain-containing protein [Corynebacterium sp. HS2168-gen11]